MGDASFTRRGSYGSEPELLLSGVKPWMHELVFADASPQQSSGFQTVPDESEMAAAEAWVRSFTLPSKVLLRSSQETSVGTMRAPFSFVYDGKFSAELLPSWQCEAQELATDSLRTQHTITYADPATGLAVRCEATAFAFQRWNGHFISRTQAQPTVRFSRTCRPLMHRS